MSLTLCLYEDSRFRQFLPATFLRPIYTLRPGVLTLFERATYQFPEAEICFAAREDVAAMTAGQYPKYPVNIIKRGEGDVLFANGRIREYGNLAELVKSATISTVFQNNGVVVAVFLKGDLATSLPAVASPDMYADIISRQAAKIPTVPTTATMYNYCFDLMNDIEKALVDDLTHFGPTLPAPANVHLHDGVSLINDESIFLGNDITIYSNVAINAEPGPVYIGANCRIESGAVITGPVFIGANSVVAAGHIAGSSIGHTCRIGGEVEASIFHSYVNKHHAGFIGHSWVGSWVNFGAMTTNSDLKNNYSPIRMSIDGQQVDTGSIKVGSFIGDHTKFGIGTLLNTGINIGVCCNIFGGSLVTDKEVPSFSWGSSGSYQQYEFEKATQTAHRSAERRNTTISDAEIGLLYSISRGEIKDAGTIDFDTT
ncbi:MAG: hypothetical protein KAT79_06760 [candidate division Zixibacteria bacterium]|nr:hypothetical protein [candidate division Zixibacteria bacterium]